MYRSEEDYLKQIYELSIEQGRQQIKTSELSEHMGFSDQSVNEKVKKLVHKDYLIFEPYKGITLTQKGIDEAIRMVRAHRLWEVFLYKELNFPWMALHDDAEELEHASRPQIIEALYHYLSEPQYCHHGNLIPNLEGGVSDIAKKQLFEMEVGDTFVVNRVMDKHDLLIFLDGVGIKIGTSLTVLDKNEFAGYFLVEIDGDEHQITVPISKMIFTFA